MVLPRTHLKCIDGNEDMNKHQSIAFVILAAGQGNRMNMDTPKQFLRVAGKSLLEHSYASLHSTQPEARMVVVVPAEGMALAKQLLKDCPEAEIIVGGESRQGSTMAALQYLASAPPDCVVIHDAARPFVTNQIVHDVLQALQQHEAVDVAIPTTDTIIVERDGFIQSIPQRKHIYRGQTPQGFHYQALCRAYADVGAARLSEFTDDCGIYLDSNPMGKVRIVQGASSNIKITEDLDLVLADELFRMRASQWTPDRQGLDVRGKKAIIFGGSQGIGSAIQNILRESGCDVRLATRSTGCDIRHLDQVEHALAEAASEMQGMDFVINTAGFLSKEALHEQDGQTIDELVAVNLTGAIYISKCSHDHLTKSRGMLLHFGSSSYTRGRAQYTPYSASKAGIVNLTQGLADEWLPEGIRVNCVVPGRTDTAMRRTNFENEEACTLLNPYEVGISACKLLSSGMTGMVVRV
jgi:2-C-methyl-D-erythritol 4-phosphate cytidylyltransferase